MSVPGLADVNFQMTEIDSETAPGAGTSLLVETIDKESESMIDDVEVIEVVPSEKLDETVQITEESNEDSDSDNECVGAEKLRAKVHYDNEI